MAVYFIIKSRSGRALSAARENHLAALSCGIDVNLYKTIAFGISAMLAAVSGGFGAVLADFVSPDGYTIFLTFLKLW